MQTRYMERTNSMARGKRALEGGGEEQQPERKRPALASVIVEALKVDSLQKLCSSLEPILRRVVSEEVERALAKLGPPRLSGRSSPKRIEGPDGRNLQLQFRSRLSLPLFTGGKVEGEQGAAIHIVLLDANSGHVLTSGPEASVKLDVLVLEGDFNNEDDEDWSQEEFESHVVKEREGKRPLLTGDLQVTLKEGVYVDTLVKKAYENWNEVIEYDGKSLLNFKQSKRSNTYQNEPQIGQIGYPNASDHQMQLPRLPASVTTEQASGHSGLQVGGFNDSMGAGFSAQSQLVNPNSRTQFDSTSFTVHEPLISNSHHAQGMRNDNSVGLALGPPQSSSSGFQALGSSMQPSGLNPFDDWTNNRDKGVDEYFTEEEIRIRSHEMLENEDMQHLLRLFSMGGHGAVNIPEDGFSFPPYMAASPMPNYDENSGRPGKAVVGWLKIKAAMRWGFFIRKKAAERRAQLVELDDE
ncbi:calmodulin binding protein, putative [Ricinus communis]|uniref:Calmodulin binding protein, putative n=1 Tax=Ricinus communis TaxID=3988 RepID=B9SJR3_RICCO|nr:calmodulin binding protein, putative [Ricinus communis]